MPAPVRLIAELCQNHNGDFDLVERMVDAAAEAGATHIKIQTIYADTAAFRPQFEEGLVQGGKVRSIKRPWRAEYDRLKGLELTSAQCERFVKTVHKAGLTPVTTCFARCHARMIADQGFKTIKVASYDCASFPMLRELAALFENVIVSTGATFDDEIKCAAGILKEKLPADAYALLHCVTIYPTQLSDANLARLQWLREFAPHVGFSDHSLVVRDGVLASKAALALGAELIERHFTILDADQSRDGPVSITPRHLKELADFAKLKVVERQAKLDEEVPNWRITIGHAQRALSEAELLNRDYYRGRFASPRAGSAPGLGMIFNWEETPLS